jgi:hypothetical protein
MPYVNGIYQADERSPLARLYASQKMRAEMDLMNQQRQMQAQRQEVLRNAYTAGGRAPAEVDQINPMMRLLGGQQQAPQANFVQRQQAPDQGLDSVIPQITAIRPQPDIPASFDTKKAMAGLFGMGDLEGAGKISDIQYKADMGGRAGAGGAEKWYGNARLVKGEDGGLYNEIMSNMGNTRLVPAGGATVGKLAVIGQGNQETMVNPYNGEIIKIFTVNPSPNIAAKAAVDEDAEKRAPDLAREIEASKGEGKRRTENEEQTSAINDQLKLVDRLKSLSANPFYGSTLGDRATMGTANKTGVFSDSEKYRNTKNMEMIANRLLVGAKPAGSGNPVASEWEMFGKTISDPSQYPDGKSFAAAIDLYRDVLSGQKRMPDTYRTKGGGKSAPSKYVRTGTNAKGQRIGLLADGTQEVIK